MSERRMLAALIRLLAATVSGCMLFIATPDFDIWPLAYLALIPILVVTRNLSLGKAFLWGWLCGTIANGGGFYWVNHLLTVFAHLHWAAAFPIYVLMMAYQGLLYAFFVMFVRQIRRKHPALPMTVVAPVVFTGLELCIPYVFPYYLAITQAWVVPLIQVADLTGPLGISFLILLLNGVAYDLLGHKLGEREQLRWRPSAVGLAVVGVCLLYGGVRIGQYNAAWDAAPKVKIGLVQANVGINQKWRREYAAKNMQLHLDTSRDLERKGAELIVWPESSYPYSFYRHMDRDWPEGSPRQVMNGISVPVLLGTVTRGRGDRFPHNSAFMMEPDGRITGKFDKTFLMIFGEYIPYYDTFSWFQDIFPEAGQFARGSEVTTFDYKGYRLAPMICLEDIVPNFGRRLAELKPHLLVNITNDAWFGATSEPWEHMALSVYRAVEMRTGLVRAVNTGVSVLVDATGRVMQATRAVDPVKTPGVEPDTLLGDMALMEGGDTVYAKVGDLFGYMNLGALLVLLLWRVKRAEKKPATKKPLTKRRKKAKKRKRR